MSRKTDNLVMDDTLRCDLRHSISPEFVTEYIGRLGDILAFALGRSGWYSVLGQGERKIREDPAT